MINQLKLKLKINQLIVINKLWILLIFLTKIKNHKSKMQTVKKKKNKGKKKKKNKMR